MSIYHEFVLGIVDLKRNRVPVLLQKCSDLRFSKLIAVKTENYVFYAAQYVCRWLADAGAASSADRPAA
jgi:hypothetical protein